MLFRACKARWLYALGATGRIDAWTERGTPRSVRLEAIKNIQKVEVLATKKQADLMSGIPAKKYLNLT